MIGPNEKRMTNDFKFEVDTTKAILAWCLFSLFIIAIPLSYYNPMGLSKDAQFGFIVVLGLTFPYPFAYALVTTHSLTVNYYKVPYEAIINDYGFSVKYRAGHSEGATWSDARFLQTTTDVGPPDRRRGHRVFYKRNSLHTMSHIDHLSWDIAEEIRRRHAAYKEGKDVSTEEALAAIQNARKKLATASINDTDRKTASELLRLSEALSHSRSYAARAQKYSREAEKIIDRGMARK